LDASFGTPLHIGPFTIGTGEVLTSFSDTPRTPDAEARAMAIQSDGRIVAAGVAEVGAGTFGTALVRYYADGTLDPDFQGGGKVVNPGAPEVTAVAIKADGKIVVAGIGSGFYLARYNPDGSLDGGFGTGGSVNTPFPFGTAGFQVSLAFQADAKIVVAG